MNVMAPNPPTPTTLPAGRQGFRVPLGTGPAAAAEARRQVQMALSTWAVPVDRSDATLLVSELVTNAIRHDAAGTVILAITCCCDQLRVEVHDTSRSWPVLVDASADAETGRGLMLVATLATDWGFYRTPAGKAVYFTLAFQPGPDANRRDR